MPEVPRYETGAPAFRLRRVGKKLVALGIAEWRMWILWRSPRSRRLLHARYELIRSGLKKMVAGA